MIQKKILFSNRKFQKLAGIYVTDNTKGPCVIVCHGFTGSKEGGGKAIDMANYFFKSGISSFLFDFSGNGESEGNFEDITLSNQVNDLDSAICYVKDLGHREIFTMGRSFGATTVICHQGRFQKNILGVIAINPVCYLTDLFERFISKKDNDKFILKSEQGEIKIKQLFFHDLKKWDVKKMASNISPCPLFVMYSEKDELVPITDAQAIFLSANSPKKLFKIPNADHRLSSNYKIVWKKAREFMLNILNYK